MNLPVPAPVVLITGASSGLGAAIAHHLAGQGYRVFGTSRRPTDEERPFSLLPLDLRDPTSIQACVAQVLAQAGRLDVLINNAGIGYTGPLELTSEAELRDQWDTNFLGAVRLCQAVLPQMRTQQAGRILNISSLGGMMGLPYHSHYAPTKFALEGYSETLSMELRPLGIWVSVIQPGDFNTGFSHRGQRIARAEAVPDYATRLARCEPRFIADEDQGLAPEVLARLVGRILRARQPRLRYRIASPVQRLAAWLHGPLPGRWFERLIMATYDIR